MKAHKSQPVRILLLIGYLAVCTLAVGPLGIEWSKDLALSPNTGYMIWNSILEFKVTLTDENMPNTKLVGLAKMAWQEMKDDYDVNKPWRRHQISNIQAGNCPLVMVAFVWKNRVYLSSSARSMGKGKQMGFAYNTILAPPPVQQALYHCILVSGGDTHRNGGNCAEEMAAVIVFNDITDGTQRLEGSRTVSWLDDPAGGRVIDPCGPITAADGTVSYKPGCRQFVEALGMVLVPDDTQPDANTGLTFETKRPCLRLWK